MPIYKCVHCNVEFPKKWNYDYHMNRKNPCKGIEIKKEVSEWACEYCYKDYSSKSSLNKHLKVCRMNKKDEKCEESESDKIKNELNRELKDSISQFKDELSSQIKSEILDIKNIIFEKQADITSYQITNHFTFLTQIQQNINVNSFGKESLDKLNPEFCVNLLASPRESVPRLVEEIHCNEEQPSNMNIILPNKDLPFIYVYENNRWIIANKKNTLNDLMDKNFQRMDSVYSHFKDYLGEDTKDVYEKYSDEYVKNTDLKSDIQNDVSNVLENGYKKIIVNLTESGTLPITFETEKSGGEIESKSPFKLKI